MFDLSRTTEVLLASLLEDEPWRSFLEYLAKVMEADWATLILSLRPGGRPSLILTPGGYPHLGREYQERFFALDPFTSLPDGEVVHYRDFVPPEIRLAGQEYEDWLNAIGSEEVIGVDMRENGILALQLRLTRVKDQPPFTRAMIAELQSLVSHLRLALRLFDRIEIQRSEQRIYADAMSNMAVGLIILDRENRIIRLNQAATEILRGEEGIKIQDGRIHLADAAQSRDFRAALARTPPIATAALRLPRSSGTGSIIMVVASAEAPEFMVASRGPATVIFLTDPDQAPAVSAAGLRELLELTPGEASVAASLAHGKSLMEIAKDLGVSHNTVRTHLRAVFTKAGVNRQSQLIHLLHYAMPGLADPKDRSG